MNSSLAGSKISPLSISIRALILAGVAIGSAGAQNLISNGDFDANAADFTGFPGYLGGANPTFIPDWAFSVFGGPGINGTDAPGTGRLLRR